MPKILVVDDEAKIRKTISEILLDEGYEIDEASNGMECVVKLKKDQFDCIIMDIKMPHMDGMEALDRIQTLVPDTPVIMVSGHGSIDVAVDAVRKGAFDFIQKPFELSRMLITIRNAMDKSSLISETKVLQKKVSKQKNTPEMIGDSAPMLVVKQTIDRVAPTDARVLITGENGTGKELVARWLHVKSGRKDKPLIEVNCAAIPSELIESELFGHEKGAFTSAHKSRSGKFEQAHGGTIFLDEIGDMSLSAQAKVLRALQEERITRVGGEKEIKVNVRVLAATNKDLKKEIAEGRFREDLYHRLAVIIVEVPSLNERRADIPQLVKHFIKQICGEYNTQPKEINEKALLALQNVNWTGNIRELRNVVERLIILSGEIIQAEDVMRYVTPNSGNKTMELKRLFDRFDNVEEILSFIEKEFSSYKNLDRVGA